MILYRWRRCFGWGVFLYWNGMRDHLGRGLPFAAFSALLCAFLHKFPGVDLSDEKGAQVALINTLMVLASKNPGCLY